MRTDRRALLALTASGVLWGTTVPLSKVALEWLPPAWLTAVRFGVAAVLLVVITGRGRVRRAFRPAVLVAGAAGYGGSVLLQNVGITRTSVSDAALLVGATPVLVAVIAAVWHRSVARPAAWAGFALSLAGVGLVSGSHAAGSSAAGNALVLASVLVSAVFTVSQARLLPGRDPVAVTAVQFAGAALAALPTAVLTEGPPPVPAHPGVLAAAALLAACGTLAPFTLFAYGQSRVPAEVAGAFLNIEPVVGAVAGTLLFGDQATAGLAFGGAAILAGIAISSRPGRPRRSGREHAGAVGAREVDRTGRSAVPRPGIPGTPRSRAVPVAAPGPAVPRLLPVPIRCGHAGAVSARGECDDGSGRRAVFHPSGGDPPAPGRGRNAGQRSRGLPRAGRRGGRLARLGGPAADRRLGGAGCVGRGEAGGRCT